MTTKRGKALGRGLEALFTDMNVNKTDNSDIMFVDINKITPNPNQPRKLFKAEKIEELASSIKIHGIIQPIVVKAAESGYEIIAGERRWRAARKAGLKDIPCLIKDIDEKHHMLMAIIENLQREDLNSLEEAKAFQVMMNKYSMTQEEVSKNVGKSRPFIANSLRLLKLSDDLQVLIKENKISAGHARALINIEDEEAQKYLAQEIVSKGLSVRQVESIASKRKVKKPRKNESRPDPEIIQIEENLKSLLSTKVSINHKPNKGKIEIEYYSDEELERLLELFYKLKNDN